MAQTTDNTKQKKKKKVKRRMNEKQRKQVKRTVIAFCIVLVLMIIAFFALIFHLMPQDVQTQMEDRVHTAQEKVEQQIFHRNDDDAEDKEDAEQETAPAVSAAPSLPLSTRAVECFGEYYGFKTYESETEIGSLGIDISSHQGEIDWSVLGESSIDFVIHRLGYRGYGSGEILMDEKWDYNAGCISATDIGLGAYFFSQAVTPEEAVEEAEFVLQHIQGYQIDHPIYFDWEVVEDPTARTANITAAEVTECALAFCQTIEEAGYEAGIYFNPTLVSSLLNLSSLAEYDFWLAEYNDTPSFPYEIDMWQYTDQGTLDGIPEKVDLNLYFIPNES